MNIALGGLILLIILSPGLIFRLALIKSESFENPLDTSNTAEIVFIILPAIIFNIFYVYLTNELSPYTVDFNELYFILSGDSRMTKNIIGDSLVPFSSYIISAAIITYIFGSILKYIILKFFLDFKLPFFSISNEWDNILSGRAYVFNYISFINSELQKPGTKYQEYLEIVSKRSWFCRQISKPIVWYEWSIDKMTPEKVMLRKDKKEIRLPEFIEASILVNTGHSNILYTGRVKNYFLAKNNNIDKIYLENATKEIFSVPNDAERKTIKENRYKFSDEDLLIIKSEDIINIDIRIGVFE